MQVRTGRGANPPDAHRVGEDTNEEAARSNRRHRRAPIGTHTDGLGIDVAYFQVGTLDNRIRPVCESTINRSDEHHCVSDPDRLDVPRTALFVEALASSGAVRVIGVDGRIGPLLEEEIRRQCDARLTDCTPVPLAYETSDSGQGWYRFHHHHMYVSFTSPSRR